MTRVPRHGAQPIDPDEDLDRAELIESAGLQNTWAVVGPAALLMVPLAAALTAALRFLRQRRRAR